MKYTYDCTKVGVNLRPFFRVVISAYNDATAEKLAKLAAERYGYSKIELVGVEFEGD